LEDELTETKKERERRKREARKAQEQQSLEIAFARRHELMAKERDNAAMLAAIDDAGLRARRIKELASNVKRQNYYRWLQALSAQKKWKEKHDRID